MLIEETVKSYLDDVLEDLDVGIYVETPNELPGKFIVLQVINRGKENQINEVTMEFRSYAPSKYEAALLDEAVREAMENIVVLPDISSHLGGGNDNPDTVLKRYRYRCYFNLYY